MWYEPSSTNPPVLHRLRRKPDPLNLLFSLYQRLRVRPRTLVLSLINPRLTFLSKRSSTVASNLFFANPAVYYDTTSSVLPISAVLSNAACSLFPDDAPSLFSKAICVSLPTQSSCSLPPLIRLSTLRPYRLSSKIIPPLAQQPFCTPAIGRIHRLYFTDLDYSAILRRARPGVPKKQ